MIVTVFIRLPLERDFWVRNPSLNDELLEAIQRVTNSNFHILNTIILKDLENRHFDQVVEHANALQDIDVAFDLDQSQELEAE